MSTVVRQPRARSPTPWSSASCTSRIGASISAACAVVGELNVKKFRW
jgi:hypothetical protein